MRTRVQIAERAVEDLAEYYAFLAAESRSAAERFLLRADETFRLLAGSPQIGRPWVSSHVRLARVRVWPVSGFPKVLAFYRPMKAGIKVLRVMHGSRDLDRHL